MFLGIPRHGSHFNVLVNKIYLFATIVRFFVYYFLKI